MAQQRRVLAKDVLAYQSVNDAPANHTHCHPPASFSAARLTVEEVRDADRYAWWQPDYGDVLSADVFPLFAYDGINFWAFPALFERLLSNWDEVPAEGWRHDALCRCEFCRHLQLRLVDGV